MRFETKYNPGDPVWYMSGNQIHEGIIQHVQSITADTSNIPRKYRFTYSLKGGYEVNQDSLFESKAHLISHLTGTEL